MKVFLLDKLAVTAITAMLCIAPALACQSVRLSPEQRVAYDRAIEDGDTERAALILREAESESVTTVVDGVLGMIPGVPDFVKGAASAVVSAVVLGGAFPRTRENYGAALAGVARAVLSPTKAPKLLGGAVKSLGAGIGYLHTPRDVEDRKPEDQA